jgi:hypothetical protein
MGLGLHLLRCLPGRFASGVYSKSVFRVGYLGCEFWTIAAAGFYCFLESCVGGAVRNPGDLRKNFPKTEKFFKKVLCKVEKMGYNKVEEIWENKQKGWRSIPWQSKNPPSAGFGWFTGAVPPRSNA